MSLQYFIILLSIVCRATGQTTDAPLVNETESAGVTNATSQSPPGSAGVTNITSESPPEQPCRNGTEWQCANETKCISIDKKCDGVFDCEDFSDETLATCRNNKHPRPLLGLILHCSFFWTDQHKSVCPHICQKSPEFCYYALAAENNESNTCVLPDYPEHGAYKIMPHNLTETSQQVDFELNFTCDDPFVMVQKKLLRCINGEWENDPTNNGHCSEACELNKDSNFTYKCPMDVYNKTECGNYVPIETRVNVAHAFHEADNPAKNVSVEILCKKDKEFDISTDCVQKVDGMQQDFENPTMVKMTDYESKFNQYKGNETNKDFMDLVDEYHVFEAHVRGNLTLMWTMAEQCDISLDFLLHNLQINKDKKKQDTSLSSTEV